MSELEQYRSARREVEYEDVYYWFKLHLVVYVAVNSVVAVLNILLMPERLWFYWPLIGWGMGLACHYVFGVRMFNKWWEETEKRIRARISKQ